MRLRRQPSGFVCTRALCLFRALVFVFVLCVDMSVISAAFFRVLLVVTLLAKRLPVVYVILQLGIFVSVLDVVRSRGFDPFAVLVYAPISLADFAISTGAPYYFSAPLSVSVARIIIIIRHMYLAFVHTQYHKRCPVCNPALTAFSSRTIPALLQPANTCAPAHTCSPSSTRCDISSAIP